MARVQGTALYVQLVGTPTARGRSKDQGHCRTCIELRLLPTKLVAEAYVVVPFGRSDGAMHKWAGPTVAGDCFAVQALGRARVGSRR